MVTLRTLYSTHITTAVLGSFVPCIASSCIPSSLPKPPEVSGHVFAATHTDLSALVHTKTAAPYTLQGIWDAPTPGIIATRDASWRPPKQSNTERITSSPKHHGWFLWLAQSSSKHPNLATARVHTLDTQGQFKPCTRTGKKHQCASSEWAYTGPTSQVTVQGKRSTCIWSHPIPGKTTVITYPRVAMDKTKPLIMQFAFDDHAVRLGRKLHVEFSYGTHASRLMMKDKPGWQTHTIHTMSEHADTLTLRVHAKHTGRAHFCYRFQP